MLVPARNLSTGVPSYRDASFHFVCDLCVIDPRLLKFSFLYTTTSQSTDNAGDLSLLVCLSKRETGQSTDKAGVSPLLVLSLKTQQIGQDQ